ncbi:hypothetical protein K523DRAFT_367377, partial [Schizophyllum commune Tattone D]
MPKKVATAVRATSGSAVSPYALRAALERVQRASGRDLHAQPSSPARSVRDGRSSGSPASPKAASRSPRQESSSEGDVPEPMDVERPVEPTEPPRTLAAGGSAALSETQAPAGDVSGSVGDGVEIGTEALSLPELGGGLSLDDPTQPSRTQMDISAAKERIPQYLADLDAAFAGFTMLNCVLHPEGGIITRLDDALQRRVTEQSAKLVFGLWNAGVFTTTVREHAVTLLVNEADVDPACLSQSARGVPPIFRLTTGSVDVK